MRDVSVSGRIVGEPRDWFSPVAPRAVAECGASLPDCVSKSLEAATSPPTKASRLSARGRERPASAQVWALRGERSACVDFARARPPGEGVALGTSIVGGDVHHLEGRTTGPQSGETINKSCKSPRRSRLRMTYHPRRTINKGPFSRLLESHQCLELAENQTVLGDARHAILAQCGPHCCSNVSRRSRIALEREDSPVHQQLKQDDNGTTESATPHVAPPRIASGGMHFSSQGQLCSSF